MHAVVDPRLDAIEGVQNQVRHALQALAEKVATVEEAEAVSGALRTLAETVATFDEQVGGAVGGVPGVRTALETLGQHVSSIQATGDTLREDVHQAIGILPEKLDELRTAVGEIVPSVHANIDALRSQVVQLGEEHKTRAIRVRPADVGQIQSSVAAILDVLRAEVAQIAPSLHANIDALRSEVAQLRGQVDVLRGETEGFRAEADQMLSTQLAPGVSRAMTRPLTGEMVGRLMPLEVVLDAVAPTWRDFVMEYDAVAAELAERYRTVNLPQPAEYAIEAVTSKLLFLIVRALRPATVFETGVANGHSTFVLLAALKRNGSGRLHSTDIRDDIAALVDSPMRFPWKYHRLPLTRSREALESLVASLPPIDLFLHDSDHSYAWQRFEYDALRKHLARGGVLISDDVDASYAFLDFCELGGYQPLLIHDSRKVIGVVQSESPVPR